MTGLIERLAQAAQSSGRWRKPGGHQPQAQRAQAQRAPRRLTLRAIVARVKGGCPRCGGFLYREPYPTEDGEGEWGCMRCGARAYGSGVHRALRWPVTRSGRRQDGE